MKYFYINNVKVKYTNSKSIINYCENIGINVPHYCYHPNLSISGNCRMCLVELKNSPKPVVSCAMNILNNMEIYTDSPLVKKSREGILEFLLLNHPLDCPICDQGGECDLQDQSYVFGVHKKRFFNFKRVVINKNIGPIVKTVMTRCIHCTRCVRFANEISGVNDLGTFGRGANMEIGTYVNKLFKSELSGNVIDLCPVGALTSKQHSFINRSWELKNSKSIDFSDSFCNDIQIYVRDNKIIKITPNYSKNTTITNWISDKTRFSYSGILLNNNNIKQAKNTKSFWKALLKEINYTVYFQDHLHKHFLKNFNVTLLINGSLSIEVLSLISLLQAKFNFLNIKKIENNMVNKSLTNNFTINSLTDVLKLNLSNLLLLVGVNTRYESYVLNIKLRQRFLKGNFKLISIGSLINLTFPNQYLGLNLQSLKKISEGNHSFCQDLISSKNPSVLLGSDIFKRKDSSKLFDVFDILNKNSFLKTNSWNGYNFLNTSLNDAGLNYLNDFKSLTLVDYNKTNLFYLLGSNLKNSNFLKIVELRLLGYLKIKSFTSNTLLLQNFNANSLSRKNSGNIKTFNLPSKVFYENKETFINTEGYLKKSMKLISLNNNSKSNWNILRSISNEFKKINLVSNEKINNLICLNLNDNTTFLKFVNFNYFPIQNFNKSFCYKDNKATNTLIKIENKYKKVKTLVFNTKTVLWLDDFYIRGKDNYSSYSSIMIKCSKSYRLQSTNFIN